MSWAWDVMICSELDVLAHIARPHFFATTELARDISLQRPFSAATFLCSDIAQLRHGSPARLCSHARHPSSQPGSRASITILYLEKARHTAATPHSGPTCGSLG